MTRNERLFRRTFALFLAGIQGPLQLYSMLPEHWDIARSLPFELCDLALAGLAASAESGSG